MFNVSKNKRDRSAENTGAWMRYDDDCSFLVARNNNPAYKKHISKSLRESATLNEGAASNEVLADSLTDQQMLEGTAYYLLLGWKGVFDGKKELAYSPEASLALLDEYDELAAQINVFATSRDNYLLKKDKKDAKNLKK